MGPLHKDEHSGILYNNLPEEVRWFKVICAKFRADNDMSLLPDSSFSSVQSDYIIWFSIKWPILKDCWGNSQQYRNIFLKTGLLERITTIHNGDNNEL